MEETETKPWSVLKRTVFLFLFSSLIITILPYPGFFTTLFSDLFFGETVEQNKFTGSGDTRFHYYQLFTTFVLTLLLYIPLLFFIRKPKRVENTYRIFLILLRYYLANIMFVYGFAKLFDQQFSAPDLFTLDKPVGSLTPMGLTWTFMGHSPVFTAFTGIAEIIAGLLMLFRRTVLFGSFISFAVMLNVMIMNFCYDIPVKLFSSSLLFWSFVLMMTEHKRLLAFMIASRTALPKEIKPYFKKRWENITAIVLKCLFFLVVIFEITQIAMNAGEEAYPLRGIYRTETFILNGDTISFDSHDTTVWTKFIIDKGMAVGYKNCNRKLKFSFKPDTAKKTIAMRTDKKVLSESNFNYELKDSVLTLSGILNNDTIRGTFRQFDHRSFLLTSRGYRWVIEDH